MPEIPIWFSVVGRVQSCAHGREGGRTRPVPLCPPGPGGGCPLLFRGAFSPSNPSRFLSPGLPLPGFSGPVRMPRAWVACVNTDPGRRPVRCRLLGSQHSYSLRDCGVNWGPRGGEGYGMPRHQEACPRLAAEKPACLGCPLPRCLFAVTTLNT